MNERRIGVLGATSFVGDSLLEVLSQTGWGVTAFSRHARESAVMGNVSSARWELLPAKFPDTAPVSVTRECSGSCHQDSGRDRSARAIVNWVSLIPIVKLNDYFPMLSAYGAKRVVALSSTSRFTKEDSSDPGERAWAQELAGAEEALISWAEGRGIEWVILRPTLIYGLGRDRNISVIAGFIRRFGFFPLFGKGEGRRQPIHARDVAKACQDTLIFSTPNRAYTISGAETLTYREMVARVFGALQRPVRFVVVPIIAFRLVFIVLRFVPRFRYLSVAMVERMNRDLAFDHDEAARDFGFSPSVFRLERTDLPE